VSEAAFIFFSKRWTESKATRIKRSKQCFCIVCKDPLLILLSSPLLCALKCVKTPPYSHNLSMFTSSHSSTWVESIHLCRLINKGALGAECECGLLGATFSTIKHSHYTIFSLRTWFSFLFICRKKLSSLSWNI